MAVEKTFTLKRRALHAGAWSFGGQMTGQFFRLASNLIMTRLLVPEMFGVMAVVSIVLAGISMFSDFGTNQSVIQSPRGDDTDFLNTIWVVQIIRGGLMWIIALLCSLGFYYAVKSGWLPRNTVYDKPELPLVLALVSITAFISGFQSTRMATASRWMLQKKLTLIEIISQLSGIMVMIVWALLDRTIWALVAGGITTNLVKTVCSHIMMPGEPNRWMWDKSAFSEIYHFGKWVFISSTLGFLVNNGDRLLLGGLINAKALGVYIIAFFIVSSITQVAYNILRNVTFPVLSEILRTHPEKFATTYYKFRLPIDIGSLFLSGLFFEAGRYVIYFLYDARYADAGEILQVLSLTLIVLRYNVVDQCYLALGKPSILVALIAIRVIVLFVLLPIAYREYQMTGALWAVVASAFSSIPLTFYYKKKFNLLSVRYELIILPVFFVGIVTGFVFVKLVA